MRFTDFTYIGRTSKCAVLKSPYGEIVYCLFGVYHYLTHNPSLRWEVIRKKNPEDGLHYDFIQIYVRKKK